MLAITGRSGKTKIYLKDINKITEEWKNNIVIFTKDKKKIRDTRY